MNDFIAPPVGLIGKRAEYPPGTKVIAYGRTSGGSSWQRGSTMKNQVSRVVDYCESKKLIVIAVLTDKSKCGADLSRPAWQKAKDLARQTGAVIVAANIIRFIRNAEESERYNDLTPETVRRLKLDIEGIRLATVCPPQVGIARTTGSTIGEATLRSIAIKAGQQSSPKKIGRSTGSKNVTQSERYQMVALKRQGLSIVDIAKQLGRVETTVSQHLQRMISYTTFAIDIRNLIDDAIQALVSSLSIIIHHTPQSLPTFQVIQFSFNTTTLPFHRRE